LRRRTVSIKTADSYKKEVAFIADYLSSELDAAERSAFEDHLNACSDCAAFLQTYKKTAELTRAFLLHQGQSR
jgi:anti-sigma factor RsiW